MPRTPTQICIMAFVIVGIAEEARRILARAQSHSMTRPYSASTVCCFLVWGVRFDLGIMCTSCYEFWNPR